MRLKVPGSISTDENRTRARNLQLEIDGVVVVRVWETFEPLGGSEAWATRALRVFPFSRARLFSLLLSSLSSNVN